MAENKVPSGLKGGGKKLWKRIISGWNPPVEMWNLLENLCRAQDRIDALSEILEREGMTTRNRYGCVTAHPAALLLRSETANFASLYRLLQLEVPNGADVRPGRPDGFTPED